MSRIVLGDASPIEQTKCPSDQNTFLYQYSLRSDTECNSQIRPVRFLF